MYDALSNPPVPEFAELTGDERTAIIAVGEMYGCRCCVDNDQAFYIYQEIRRVLKTRERRIFECTMAAE